ncbi:hypothetical protein IE81DRAFT_319848 [Ceraceosorus guamensis]|uniref:G-patch domain-containing protein n=1 Tax=Ceraceosorus guamensis TaxID=1522189 RepID=A0A316W6R5_9BASI|nr:hypothetical protein IE81DRAFT_319848 [Ceraceosorus guamensis]PWN45567.1 hypothetical protein IE81DRAFT_319848 [Ceraceosorus guamensis]
MPARAFGHEEDEDEGDSRNLHSSHVVVAFSSTTGAEPARKRSRTGDAAPKVIPLTGDGDWMAERKRRLNLGRHAAQLGGLVSMQRRDGDRGGGGSANQSRIGDGSTLTPGLTRMRGVAGVAGVAPAAPSSRTHAEEEAEIAALQAAASDTTPSASKAGDAPTDDDAEARAALLAGGDQRRRGRDTERIIEMDETALTQADAANRPDAPTVEEYAALPISEFGAAMLRGMGWREGQGAGRNRQGPTTSEQVKKRPALLGLGAKERKDVGGTGGTGSTSRGKDAKRSSRPDSRYVPVVKRSAEEGSRERMADVSLGERNGARHDSRPSEARSSRSSRHRDEYDRERHSTRRQGDSERHSTRRQGDHERYARDDDRRYGSDRRDADWSSSRQDRDGYARRER